LNISASGWRLKRIDIPTGLFTIQTGWYVAFGTF
jgi:hypothetical protein